MKVSDHSASNHASRNAQHAERSRYVNAKPRNNKVDILHLRGKVNDQMALWHKTTQVYFKIERFLAWSLDFGLQGFRNYVWRSRPWSCTRMIMSALHTVFVATYVYPWHSHCNTKWAYGVVAPRPLRMWKALVQIPLCPCTYACTLVIVTIHDPTYMHA